MKYIPSKKVKKIITHLVVPWLTEDKVIQHVKNWIESELNNYQEPTRAGTPKGDPIGLSRKKFEAALWMVLFPQVFRLKDIAERIGVSDGVLRVWRTQEDFKKAMEDFSHRCINIKYILYIINNIILT